VGRELGHVTYFQNFGTPSTSQEWLKLEASNLVHGLATISPIQKCKIRSKGMWTRSQTTFQIFGRYNQLLYD